MACANPIPFPRSAEPHFQLSEREIQAVLNRFADYLYAHCSLADSTIENYLGVVKRALPSTGPDPAETLILAYFGGLRRHKASYAHLTVTAVGLERWMASLGRTLRLPRPRKPKAAEIEPLAEVDIAIMIRAVRKLRQKAILSVLAYSGIRNRELCALDIRDVDLSNQSVTVRGGKGAKDRVVNIAGPCVETLACYLRERSGKPDDRLFLTERRGLEMEPQDVRKLVRSFAAAAGIDRRVWPHLLRHSLATNLVDRGADVFTIKHQLGHANLATSMRYIHTSAARAARQYHAFAPHY